jgi:hypothetical protein
MLVEFTTTLIIGSFYMGILMGTVTLVIYLTTLSLAQIGVGFIQRAKMKVTKATLEAKDTRTSLLKNIITNISYVKMRSWETFYSTRMFRRREVEVQNFIKMGKIFSLLVFFNYFNKGIALSLILNYLTFYKKEAFGFETISAF